MYMPTPTGGFGLITLSYWRTFEGLHTFAHAPVHREGWDWWNQITKSHPHMGIMHETYAVPKGRWENVYQAFWPIGMVSEISV